MNRKIALEKPTVEYPFTLTAEYDAVGKYFMLEEYNAKMIPAHQGVMLTVEQLQQLVEFLKTAPTMYDQIAEDTAARKAAEETR